MRMKHVELNTSIAWSTDCRPHQSGPVLIASIPGPITILSLYYYQLRAVSLPLVDLVPILPSEKQLTEVLEMALTGDGRSKKVTSG